MTADVPRQRPMVVTRDIPGQRAARAELSAQLGADAVVGVVMTMGALHDGHAALVRQAREECDAVIATVFVNPLQFGEGEDLDAYPRTLDDDLALLDACGVDVVFTPTEHVMYPTGPPLVTVQAGELGGLLEGAHRPGHFDGMLTVVAKLLHLTQPVRAYFGQKDAQQLVLIRRMVSDLDFGCDVVAVPTVRDPDGLAMSSRNRYLSSDERREALCLSQALAAGQQAAGDGASAVRQASLQVLDAQPGFVRDYLELVDPATMQPVADNYTGHALLAVAGSVGTTRLIDNTPIDIATGTSAEGNEDS